MAGSDFVQESNWLGAVKSETTEGVDAFGAGLAPVAWTKFRKLEITQVIEMRRDSAGTATDTPEAAVPVPIECKVDWEMPLFPINAAATSHALEAVLNSCKLKSTLDSGTDIRYSPYSGNDVTNTPPCTFVKYELNEAREAKRLTARYVRSIPEIVLERGQTAYIKGTGVGVYTEEPATFTAAPTLPTEYSDDILGMAVAQMTFKSEAGSLVWIVDKATMKSGLTHTRVKGGDVAGGGTVSDVLLHKADNAANWMMDFTLAKGSLPITDLITRMRTGEIVDFEVLLTDGARTSTWTMLATQVRSYAKQSDGLKKYQATMDFVRKTGTAGDNDFEWVFA